MKEKALEFWTRFLNQYPTDNERVLDWVQAVASGKGDWFRNKSLTSVVLSEHCRVGRIGFDNMKYELGQIFVDSLERELGLHLQN